LMNLTEEMLRLVAINVTGSEIIKFQGNSINLGGRWCRMGMFESLEKIGGMSPDIFNNREKLLDFANSQGIPIKQKTGTKTIRTGKIIAKLFDILVEPKLIQPTYIVGYPVEISPLSRKNNDDPTLTDRFELFIAGHEIANGFSELNDPDDQKKRFLQQVEDREGGDEEAHYMDEDYVKALEYGMPPTAGEGIGIDRLAMLLTDSASIREVILFPHMKKTKN